MFGSLLAGAAAAYYFLRKPAEKDLPFQPPVRTAALQRTAFSPASPAQVAASTQPSASSVKLQMAAIEAQKQVKTVELAPRQEAPKFTTRSGNTDFRARYGAKKSAGATVLNAPRAFPPAFPTFLK